MRIDQFLTALAPPGDGIADYARSVRDYLRKVGVESDIYVFVSSPDTAHETRPLEAYPYPAGAQRWVHYSDANLVDFVVCHALPITLFFHNITPSEFFRGYEPAMHASLTIARLRLWELAPYTLYALANSRYSEQELKQLGFARTGTAVLNVPQRFAGVTPDADRLRVLREQLYLLFVGRLAPNKRQEDVIRLLWVYRQINPAIELYLIGGGAGSAYGLHLQQLIIELNLEQAVHITGHVTQSELAAFYQAAAAYVSMSEHEGFGLPLVESMLHDLPVVAYASSAVTEVVEGAGVLIRHKRLHEWALVLDRVVRDRVVRQQIIDAQRLRAMRYSTARFDQSLQHILANYLAD